LLWRADPGQREAGAPPGHEDFETETAGMALLISEMRM
jgi:hypothetical protein